MKQGRVSHFFLPGSTSELPPQGCGCSSPGVSNWRLGGVWLSEPMFTRASQSVWEVKAPQVWNGVTWTGSTPCSIGWEMGRGAMVWGGKTGHVVPPLWMPGDPAYPAQSFPGMCGSDWDGKLGSKCHPLGGEGLPSLGARQEDVVLSLGGREGLQWATHPPAPQV